MYIRHICRALGVTGLKLCIYLRVGSEELFARPAVEKIFICACRKFENLIYRIAGVRGKF